MAFKTREATSRKKAYQPPALLDAPKPNSSDVTYRWVRVHIHNEDDAKNISMQRRDGWEFVRADEHPDFVGAVHQEGRFGGCIGVGDLVLAKNSTENVEAREEYFRQMTAAQEAAVDNDINKEEAQIGHIMPVSKKRSTAIIHGTKKPTFDE